MMRKLLFLIVFAGCLGAPGAAVAQATEPVVADPPVEQPATLGGGALRHTADSNSFGSVPVYAGLSLFGVTLAGIVRQRRASLQTAGTATAPAPVVQRSGRYWVKPALPRRRTPVATEPQPRRVPVRSRA